MTGKNAIVHMFPHIGFLQILTLIFITLKLIGKIAWSWWWVLSPIWIPMGLMFAVVGSFVGILFLFFVIGAIVEACKK